MYGNKADLQTQLGNASEAIKLLDKATESFEKRDKFSFYDFDVKLLEEYGDANYKLENYSLALKYHKEAENLVKVRGLSYLEEDYTEKIYLDYKALGDYENTIKYLEKNNKLKSNSFHDKDREYSQYLYNQFENNKDLSKISELERIGNRAKISSACYRLTLSMGITTAYIGTIKDYDDCIKKADAALYKAKQCGRNKYIFIK